MAHSNDGMLELLLDHGLIGLVRAGADLTITAVRGGLASDIPLGADLCDAVPVLYGLDEAVRALAGQPGERLVITNVAVIGDDETSTRLDFVVVADRSGGGYLLSITPSLANDELSIELDQNLRRKLQLETRVAAQARAIAAANGALKRTNDDLVNFTRVISHDLKAPMRAIRYSAEDITEALSGTEDEQQIVALDELRQQSVRLSRMVTDLLTYSRLGDKAGAVAPVDTRALIEEIVRSIGRPASLAVKISGEWPQITTIGVLLDVALRNLIDNAVKHHDRGEGEIAVSSEKLDDALFIVVSDDGPGIPADYQEAVLRPFMKGNRDDHESSGLGLSMVGKVIADVGGQLEIGNRIDGRRGTRIAISWPLTIVTT